MLSSHARHDRALRLDRSPLPGLLRPGRLEHAALLLVLRHDRVALRPDPLHHAALLLVLRHDRVVFRPRVRDDDLLLLEVQLGLLELAAVTVVDPAREAVCELQKSLLLVGLGLGLLELVCASHLGGGGGVASGGGLLLPPDQRLFSQRGLVLGFGGGGGVGGFGGDAKSLRSPLPLLGLGSVASDAGGLLEGVPVLLDAGDPGWLLDDLGIPALVQRNARHGGGPLLGKLRGLGGLPFGLCGRHCLGRLPRLAVGFMHHFRLDVEDLLGELEFGDNVFENRRLGSLLLARFSVCDPLLLKQPPEVDALCDALALHLPFDRLDHIWVFRLVKTAKPLAARDGVGVSLDREPQIPKPDGVFCILVDFHDFRDESGNFRLLNLK